MKDPKHETKSAEEARPDSEAGCDLVALYDKRPDSYRILHEILTHWTDNPVNRIRGTVGISHSGIREAWRRKMGKAAPGTETVRKLLRYLSEDLVIERPYVHEMVEGGRTRKGYRARVLVRAFARQCQEETLQMLIKNMSAVAVMDVVNSSGKLRVELNRVPSTAPTPSFVPPPTVPTLPPAQSQPCSSNSARLAPGGGHREEDREVFTSNTIHLERDREEVTDAGDSLRQAVSSSPQSPPTADPCDEGDKHIGAGFITGVGVPPPPRGFPDLNSELEAQLRESPDALHEAFECEVAREVTGHDERAGGNSGEPVAPPPVYPSCSKSSFPHLGIGD